MEACLTAVPVRWGTLERSKRSASSQSRLISSDLFGSLTVWLPGAEGLLQRLAGYTWVLPVVPLATCVSCSVDKSSQSVTPAAQIVSIWSKTVSTQFCEILWLHRLKIYRYTSIYFCFFVDTHNDTVPNTLFKLAS